MTYQAGVRFEKPVRAHQEIPIAVYTVGSWQGTGTVIFIFAYFKKWDFRVSAIQTRKQKT